MSINLMELLKDQVLGGVAGKIGEKLGEDEQKVQGGLDALLPTILGGIAKKASSDDGAAELEQAMESSSSSGSILDSLGGLLGGSSDEESEDQDGNALVNMIFGDRLGGIMETLAKTTGMNAKSLTGILGMIVPVILGFLQKQKTILGLDMKGMSGLLTDQKEHLSSALPAGASDALGLASISSTAAESSPQNPAPQPTTPSAPNPGSFPTGILVGVALIAIVGIGGYLISTSGKKKADTDDVENVEDDLLSEDDLVPGSEPEPATLGPADALELASTTKNLATSVASLRGILTEIKDVPSATAKLPDLKAADEALGLVIAKLDKAPAGLQAAIRKAAAKVIPEINDLLVQAMSNDGVPNALESVVFGLQDKLNKFRK